MNTGNSNPTVEGGSEKSKAGKGAGLSIIGRWQAQQKILCDETQLLVVKQHIFKEVNRIVVANPTASQESSFHPWLVRLYVDSSLVGVRRLSDRGKRASLWGLLDSIKKHHELIHVDRHVAMWTDIYGRDDPWPAFGKEDFERLCGSGQRWLSKTAIAQDQNSLLEKTRALDRFTNDAVAHLSLEAPATVPTFSQLEEAIACLEKIVIKYGILLNGSEAQPLLPTWQYDWTRIFRAAWLEPRKASEV